MINNIPLDDEILLIKGCLFPHPLVFLSRPPPDVRRVEIGYTPVYLRTNKTIVTIRKFLSYISCKCRFDCSAIYSLLALRQIVTY